MGASVNTTVGSVSPAALEEAIRVHYATEQEKERQDGEWTVTEYLSINGLPESKKNYVQRMLKEEVAAGVILERKNCINEGRACTFYKFRATM